MEGLTFCQRDRWVSQLDWCLVAEERLEDISSFKIHQSHPIKTNHAAISVKLKNRCTGLESLVERSHRLQQDQYQQQPPIKYRKGIKASKVDCTVFLAKLPEAHSLSGWNEEGTDVISNEIANAIYSAAKEATRRNEETERPNERERWKNIVQSRDPKSLWRAINWKGEYDNPEGETTKPSEEAFCKHFQRLLNPSNEKRYYEIQQPKYIPLLDDPIMPNEVLEAIEEMKMGKAAGLDGVTPDLLKFLHDEWIVELTDLFNRVFVTEYPTQWNNAKMFTLYKKGDRLDPGNYRGISIPLALAKAYDSVLSRRFRMWYTPCKEQAGSQKGRGCEEQVLTLKLLIDTARKTKQSLLIAFIDYEKAYDKVDRTKLFQMLDEQGCGSQFLKALQHSMTEAAGVIGSSTFTTGAGVKQGGATSCPLFTFYIDATVRALRNCGDDGWLRDMCCLLFMDDTAVVATNEESMAKKLKVLKESTDQIGMKIHPRKSQFMTINCTRAEPFQLDDVRVALTTEYVYLGCLIRNDRATQVLSQEMQMKWKHVWKFASFLRKNGDAPFTVKKKVWESCVTAAIAYGCQTWLTTNRRAFEQLYLTSLKSLLGVRPLTPNNLTVVESGVPGPLEHVDRLQRKFYRQILTASQDSNCLSTAMQIASDLRAPGMLYIRKVMANETQKEKEREAVRQAQESSRATAYKALNPSLEQSQIYRCSASTCPKESHRIAYTRMRLSSHRLRIETGRWARIPREERMCSCGQSVQDEHHVLLRCQLTERARRMLYGDRDLPETLNELFDQSDQNKVAKLCYEALKICEH
jgi:hypothetical protein